jgi:hypothetical protein
MTFEEWFDGLNGTNTELNESERWIAEIGWSAAQADCEERIQLERAAALRLAADATYTRGEHATWKSGEACHRAILTLIPDADASALDQHDASIWLVAANIASEMKAEDVAQKLRSMTLWDAKQALDKLLAEEAEWWAARFNSGNGLCKKEVRCSECKEPRERLDALRAAGKGKT